MIMANFTPTPYKVSTITATGGINTCINLDTLYNNVRIVEFKSDEDGFVYIEFGKKKSESISRGYHKKLSVTRRKKTASKRFDNQATLILRDSLHNYVNIKVFRNGNIQMTGLKSIEAGRGAIDKVIEEIRRIHAEEDPNVVENVDNIQNINNRVRLINSDFRVGFDIKRDKLHKIVRFGGVFCSYEPCIYPGVKIEFYWNRAKDGQDGMCTCEPPCNGKGCGDMLGFCKKITIAVFQSGCIIITGAQSYEQIDDAYTFICNVLQENFDEVHKIQFVPVETVQNTVVKKKVLIKKNNIRSVLA